MKARILGVGGSLNRRSLSRLGVGHVLDHAKSLGAEVRMLDLLESPLPIFNPNDRSAPEIARAREQVEWANAFVLGSPDYHGGMSGAMKNFLDCFWKEFAGKLFGYICASHEHGLTVMDQMRTAVRQCYGWSTPYGVVVTDSDFDASGAPSGEKARRRLGLLARDLVTYAPMLRGQFEADVAGGDSHAGFAAHYQPKAK